MKIWGDEVSWLRGQLLFQQQWLPTIASFKPFQTLAFEDFLVGCLEFFKSAIITKTLDDVMSVYPFLDLQSFDGYDQQTVETADDDLMRAVLALSILPFLNDLRGSTRVRTFEEFWPALWMRM